ncbi:flippase [Marinobacter koreensis]|uniref:Flippase n=1 Tax=Marinobacter koreensis TaxID=335974 RepID=A0ABW0RJ29_9GAMM|nr:flippase [Marinobacter koreensis]MCK7546988.1 flippase [Marinobacter koreensis]
MFKSWLNRVLAQSRGDALRARLIRGGLGSAGIQALSRVLALALGIVLARGLGADGYGTYAYAFAIMGLLMVAAEAGVPTLLLREVAAAQSQQRWGLLYGALIRAGQLVLLASTSVSIAGMLVLTVMFDRLSPGQFYTTLLMLLVLPLAAMTQAIASAMRGLHRVVVGQALDMLLRPLLVLAGVGSLFLLAPALRQPEYAMGVQFVAAGIVLLVGGLMLRRYLPAASRTEPVEYQTRRWLSSTLPFALIGGAGIINNQADIIMLGWFGGTADVGIYRVAVQGATLVVFGLQAANAVVAPQFARLYAQGDLEKLQRLVTASARVVLLAALPLALAFVFAGGAIVTWVFGTEFVASHLPLAILALGQLANAAFGSVGFLLNMTGNERQVARALWQTALLNIVLNALLIPLYGMVGAAVASSISLLMWNVLLFGRVRKKLGINSFAFGSNVSSNGDINESS